MKTTFFALFILITTVLTAQNEFPYDRQLKQPLNDSDKIFLSEMLTTFMGIQVDYSLEITSTDAQPAKKWEVSKPPGFKNIEKNKKLAAGTNGSEKAALYLSIGQEYQRLNRKHMAGLYFDSAYTLCKTLEGKEADSTVYFLLSTVCSEKGSFEESLGYLFKLKEVDSIYDGVATCIIPLMYVNVGRMDEAREFLEKSFIKWPQGEVIITYDMMFKTASFIELAQYRKDFLLSDSCAALPPDSLIDFSRLKNAWQNNPGNMYWECLYKGMQVMGILTKSFSISRFKDSLNQFPKVWFFLSPQDKAQLQALKEDFRGYTKTEYKFFAYKLLGTIAFLEHNLDEGAEHFIKAAQLKPASKSSFQSNGADMYNNAAACYLVLGDTAKAEKTIRKKIKEIPAVNPIAQDYVVQAYFDLWHGNRPKALESFNKAIVTDSSCSDAWVGIAACHIWNGNYAEADPLINKALVLKPNSTSGYPVWAVTSLLQNNPARAYLMLKTAYKNNNYKEDVTKILERLYVKQTP